MTNLVTNLLEKCNKIVEIEKKKYETKGPLNTLIAYLLLFIGVWLGREVGLYFWPAEIENKALFYFVGVVAITISAQFISFLLFLPGYLNLSAYYQKYQINKRSSWPWERPNWKLVMQKTIYNFIMNELFIAPLILYCSTISGIKYRFTEFPSFWELFSQIMAVYIIQDSLFYWGHRMFHTYPSLYKLHKIHHEYDKVFTFSTEYFHPVDFVLGNILPSALGFVLLPAKAHCFTSFFWIFWKVLMGTEAHSGYEFPWSPMRVLPFVGGPSFHDHHHSNNVGNYAGSCYLWDLMLGTSDHYWKQILEQKQ